MSVRFSGPSPRSLEIGAIHVWAAPLAIGDEDAPAFWRVLSADERERAERFVFERDRRWFVAARGFLRFVLSAYVGADPEGLRFTYAERGKPALHGDGSGVEFNLSHSGGLALIALTRDAAVGVDVEQIREVDDLARLARQCFAPSEREELDRVSPPERLEAFFNCWTRKEAYIKALGDGLSCPLESFEVTLRPADPARLRAVNGSGDQAARWWMDAFRPAPGFIGAVVAAGTGYVVERGLVHAPSAGELTEQSVLV